jgi:GntR family colanic acid and biofilm gene transcriptional regulator
MPAPKGGLAGFVERSLHRALLEGHLRPGERLITRELAERLGTSLTPVREALLKLVVSGALEIGPAQSFRVPTIELDRYLEISEIRRALEGLAVEQAAARVTPAELGGLEEMKNRFLAAKEDRDSAQALTHNYAFRFGIYKAAGMPVLLEMIERLWLQIGPTLNYLYPQPTTPAVEEHNYNRLLAAMKQHDGAAARAMIDRAIDQGNEIMLKNMGGSDAAAGERDTSIEPSAGRPRRTAAERPRN